MKIIQTIPEMQQYMEVCRSRQQRIGFVPTMGYLHEGHLSLITQIRDKCDILVVSIFVNPTQFGPQEDLKKYPRDFARDEDLCREQGVDVIFYPAEPAMYPDPYRTFITVEQLDRKMCGITRPHHFRGVVTVVAKLFHIVKPHLAIFGEKDFQQAVIIQQMTRDLNFDVEIITGPIIREEDGLALSSRNKYLNAEDRRHAAVLYQSLVLGRDLYRQGMQDPAAIIGKMKEMITGIPNARIDYVVIVDPLTLESVNNVTEGDRLALAVYIGSTRLIDNVALTRD